MPGTAVAPSPSELDRFGRLALVAVVASSVVASVAMNDAAPATPVNLGILFVGGLFLAALVLVGDRLERRPPAVQIAYFAGQLGLASALFLLQARLGSFGMTWIVLMPLLVQATFVWPWPGIAALSAATVLLPAAHVLVLAGSGAAVEAAIGITAAVVFVLLFSAVTVREREARAASERLTAELAAANHRLGERYAVAEELAAARERNHLAREIHDTLGHTLTIVNVQLESARLLVGERPGEAVRRLERAAALTREGLAEVRRSVNALRAGPLDRGLVEALEGLREEGGAGGPAIEVEVRGDRRPLPPEVALTLYRAAQEGLTNVRRHAGARSARLRLDYRDPGRVRLAVEDDGRGSAELRDGFGLLGIRERVAAVRGELSIESRPGAGLAMTLEVPG